MKRQKINWNEVEAARVFYAVRTLHPGKPNIWKREAIKILKRRNS